MAQTSRSFIGGFWPISLPRFHGLKGSEATISGVGSETDIRLTARPSARGASCPQSQHRAGGRTVEHPRSRQGSATPGDLPLRPWRAERPDLRSFAPTTLAASIFGHEEAIEMAVAPRSPERPVESHRGIAQENTLSFRYQQSDWRGIASDDRLQVGNRQGCGRSSQRQRASGPAREVGPHRRTRRPDDKGQAGASLPASSKPSSNQPVIPPVMIFTGRPSCARRSAPRAAPLQCGPAQ